jgi:hypothetical protein
VALAIAGGESSGNSTCYHLNVNGSTDYGLMEINDRAHPEYFHQAQTPTSWIWSDYLDSAKAAFDIYVSGGRSFGPWAAYTGGGYLAERYKGRSWMDWASFGCGQMQAALVALTTQGKTQAAALAMIASVDDDPLLYA